MVGESFEINNQYGTHLHFVIAEESHKADSLIILVYLSSKETIFKDNTTIIKFGEHPYITEKDRDSWIRYQNTLECSREDILPLITQHYGKISESLLHKIQVGFERSNKIDKWIKKDYFEWKENKLFDSLK